MKNNKLTLIQDIAGTLENATEEQVLAWKAMAAASPETWQALLQIMPSLASALDKHKTATLVLATLEKLHPSRSHWTVAMMVKCRMEKKRQAIACLPDDKRRKRAEGHLRQAEEVGEMLIRLLGPDTDIDSITPGRMQQWKQEYAQLHTGKGHKSGELAASTVEARMNLAGQYFNSASEDGWLGVSPCHIADVPRSNVPVALNFQEFAGVTIALAYLDKQACRVFIDEVFTMARDIEARGTTKQDTDLVGMRLKVNPKASSQYGAEGSGTTVGDEMIQRSTEIIDAHYQWVRFLDDPKFHHGWTRNRKTLNDNFRKARIIADCERWSKKDTGRHTGRNLYRLWSIPDWKIQELMGHVMGSKVTNAHYLARLTSPDAGGMLLVTPYFLGLIDKPYPYILPPEDVLHVGHRVKLTDHHQLIIDEYLPKLHEIHERIKKKLGIKA